MLRIKQRTGTERLLRPSGHLRTPVCVLYPLDYIYETHFLICFTLFYKSNARPQPPLCAHSPMKYLPSGSAADRVSPRIELSETTDSKKCRPGAVVSLLTPLDPLRQAKRLPIRVIKMLTAHTGHLLHPEYLQPLTSAPVSIEVFMDFNAVFQCPRAERALFTPQMSGYFVTEGENLLTTDKTNAYLH